MDTYLLKINNNSLIDNHLSVIPKSNHAPASPDINTHPKPTTTTPNIKTHPNTITPTPNIKNQPKPTQSKTNNPQKVMIDINNTALKQNQAQSRRVTNDGGRVILNICEEKSTVIANNLSALDCYDEVTGGRKFFDEYAGHVTTKINRTILNDLKTLPYPDDIKNEADVIYNKMKYQVRRGKIRNQMIFYCVYCSYRELNREVDPIQLGLDFGLNHGDVQRCESLFSPLQTGYKPPCKDTSPLQCLSNYCEEIGLAKDAVDDIKILAKHIMLKEPSLYQENPHTVAAGLLRYFVVMNGIIIDDPQKLKLITGRSTATIDNMYRLISSIDNK